MNEGTVLISGGTKGIGRSIVKHLLHSGYNVATFSRNKQSCLDLAKELSVDYDENRFLVLPADLTASHSLHDFTSRVIEKFGLINILINNAGMGYYAESDAFEEDKFQQILKVNLVGAAILSGIVIPYMKLKKSGLIINISSIAGRTVLPHVEFYGATKFALMGYSQGIRNELKVYGIKVCTVCPGMVKTDFFEEKELERRRFLQDGESLPMLEVDDIARIVVFICQQPMHCDIQDILVMPFNAAGELS